MGKLSLPRHSEASLPDLAELQMKKSVDDGMNVGGAAVLCSNQTWEWKIHYLQIFYGIFLLKAIFLLDFQSPHLITRG